MVPIGHPEQGLRRCLPEGLDQRFSFVCGAAYLLLKRIRCCCVDHCVPNFEFHNWLFKENSYYSINFASLAFTEKQTAGKKSFKNKFSLIKKIAFEN